MSKVKVTRLINTVTENQSYLQKWKTVIELVYGWNTMTRITDMNDDIKGQEHQAV